MAKQLTRAELEAQLASERARNDALSTRVKTAEETALTARGPTITEAVYTDHETFEAWRDAGFARGYTDLVKSMGNGNAWEFIGSMRCVLGGWDGSRGFFIERRSL